MAAKEQVVAFLGPKASYTHQATLDRFDQHQYRIIPHSSIEDVFAAVQSTSAAYGVVPFENSSNGSVVFTLDLFADIHNRFPDILVCDEIYLPVHHCLLGRAPAPPPSSSSSSSNRPTAIPTPRTELPWRSKLKTSNATPTTTGSPSISGDITPTQATPHPSTPHAQPTTPLSHIRKLYSHPQAWGQCKLFLATHLKHAERQDVSSTSRAAELVAQDASGEAAAISSRIAAELNGLDVLAEGIEDVEGNSTRFFVLRHRQRGGAVAKGHADDDDGVDVTAEDMGGYKTLVAFTVEHGEPGALAGCLAVFEKFRLNLTSINTRPSGEAVWHYIFLVELMVRKREDGAGGAVNDALRELGKVARSWRWLGSWEDALKKA